VNWRLIDTGPSDAYLNMALDEAIARKTMENSSPPTLRFYGWQTPSVSLGRFQNSSDVDLSYCAERSIPVIRRPTGGRGILHKDELTYSFSTGKHDTLFFSGLRESYRQLSAAFSMAFRGLGFDVKTRLERSEAVPLDLRSPLCFQSPSYAEITLGEKKILGSAQRRWPGGVLQQGSIPLRIDRPTLRGVFGVEVSGDSMAGLNEIMPALSLENLKEAVKEAFQAVFGIRLIESLPSRGEEALAVELLRRKYQLPEWNFLR
jgi:lipoate-protein ligase A